MQQYLSASSSAWNSKGLRTNRKDRRRQCGKRARSILILNPALGTCAWVLLERKQILQAENESALFMRISVRGEALWTKRDAKERRLLWPAQLWPQGHTGRPCWSSPALHHPRALSGAGTRPGRQHQSRAQQRRSCGNCTGAQTCAWAHVRPHPWAPTEVIADASQGAVVLDKGQGGGKSQGNLSCGCWCELFCRHRRERPRGNSHYTEFILYPYSHH